MIFYILFLILLIILWILFVYNLNLTIFFSLNSLVIKLFKIPFIQIKGEKFKKFLIKLVPTNKKELEEEIDLSSLFALIHYDVIEIKIKLDINDYSKLIISNSLIEIIYYFFIEKLNKKVDKYTFLVEKSSENDVLGLIKCNLNIGVILFNYILIKRRYRHEKTS